MQTIKVGSTQVHITNEVFFGIKSAVGKDERIQKRLITEDVYLSLQR
jgi:hypothetical protein